MSYQELLNDHETELNNFSKDKIFYFFGTSENEILNKMQEKNLKPADLISIGLSGYILKEYWPEFKEILNRQAKEQKEYTLNNIYEVVKYYCWDYEIEISLSYSYNDVLTILCDLNETEIKENETEIKRAFKDYKKEFYELN